MRWDDLRYLEALARNGSAPAAARELGVAASTIYRRVAGMEESLGGPCIVRGSNPVVLTPAGRALADMAKEMGSGLSRVRDLVADDTRSLSGVVGLTTVEGFLPFLTEALRRCAERHPELRVDLHLADAGPSVWRREVDLAIGVMHDPPEGLIGRRLAPVRYGVFGTEAACARSPRRWIVTGAPRHHTPEARWERGHVEHAVVSTGSRNAMLAFARAGIGVAALPRRLAALHPELTELTEHRDALATLERPVWLLTHPEIRRSARVRALLDLLLEALE